MVVRNVLRTSNSQRQIIWQQHHAHPTVTHVRLLPRDLEVRLFDVQTHQARPKEHSKLATEAFTSQSTIASLAALHHPLGSQDQTNLHLIPRMSISLHHITYKRPIPQPSQKRYHLSKHLTSPHNIRSINQRLRPSARSFHPELDT